MATGAEISAALAKNLDIKPDFGDINKLIATQSDQISNVGDIFSKIAKQQAEQREFDREQNLKELEYQEKIRQFNEGLLQNALDRDNRLAVADLGLQGTKYSADKHFLASKYATDAANKRMLQQRQFTLDDRAYAEKKAQEQGAILARLYDNFTGKPYAEVQNRMDNEINAHPDVQALEAQSKGLLDRLRSSKMLYDDARLAKDNLVHRGKYEDYVLDTMKLKEMDDAYFTGNSGYSTGEISDAHAQYDKKWGKDPNSKLFLDERGDILKSKHYIPNVALVDQFNQMNSFIDKYAADQEQTKATLDALRANSRKANDEIRKKYQPELDSVDPGLQERMVMDSKGNKSVITAPDPIRRQQMVQSELARAGFPYNPATDMYWQMVNLSAQGQSNLQKTIAADNIRTQNDKSLAKYKHNLENRKEANKPIFEALTKQSPYKQYLDNEEDIERVGALTSNVKKVAEKFGTSVNIDSLASIYRGTILDNKYGTTALGRAKALGGWGVWNPERYKTKSNDDIDYMNEMLEKMNKSENILKMMNDLGNSSDDRDMMLYEILTQSMIK